MPQQPIHQASAGLISRATSAQRDQVVYFCRETVDAQLNFNTQGNISLRLRRAAGAGPDGQTGDAMLITPSGTRYDQLRPEHLFVVSIDTGEVLEDPLNGTMPSAETPVHVEHYRTRPDVGAIVHTESAHVNAFGITSTPIDPVLLNMILYAKVLLAARALGVPPRILNLADIDIPEGAPLP